MSHRKQRQAHKGIGPDPCPALVRTLLSELGLISELDNSGIPIADDPAGEGRTLPATPFPANRKIAGLCVLCTSLRQSAQSISWRVKVRREQRADAVPAGDEYEINSPDSTQRAHGLQAGRCLHDRVFPGSR